MAKKKISTETDPSVKLPSNAENLPPSGGFEGGKEGTHFYIENGLWVFTEKYLQERGYCCQNDCRHCPYGFKKAKSP